MGSDGATTCFGGEKYTELDGPTSQGEETPRSRTGVCQPLSITQGPTSFLWPSLFLGLPLLLVRLLSLGGLCCYISLFCSSSSYTCQSSMSIFKCTSHQPFFLVLCELLWPTSPYPGVTSISKGVQGVSCVYLIRR